jgi:PAS domain S-box-containing protein
LAKLFRTSSRPDRGDAETPELDAVATLSTALLGARDVESVGRLILDQVRALLGVDVALLAMISEDGTEASGLLARAEEGDVGWWPDMRLDLRSQPSMIASAAAEATPLQVYDVESSPRVHRGIAERIGAKSAVFMPLISGDRVQAVVIGATTTENRHFGSDDMAILQTLAAEGALALERARSADELASALERERLVAEIGRKVRSEVDLDAVLRVAVEEVGRAMGVMRCFVRLGEIGEPMPILAEWDAPGIEPVGSAAPRLPVLNLAARERRTAAVPDVATAPELKEPELGSVDLLLGLGARAVLATPIVVFGRMIGVFGLHRVEPGGWSAAEVSLAEAVAREVGLAFHSARLLEENRRRLEAEAALLKAGQALTAELRLETVLQRLVVEVTNLLEADAADCHLYDAKRRMFRCAAVYGFSADLLEFEFPADRGLASEALRTGLPVRSADYSELPDKIPHSAYEGFKAAIVAPMTWSGEVRGVFGVGLRDDARAFSDLDEEIIEAFASLASLALRNAASFEQSERQARVQQGFYRIAAVLGEPLSLARTYAALAQAAAEALGGAFSAVLMSGPPGLEPAGEHSLPAGLDEFLAVELEQPADPLAAAARSQRILSAAAVLRDERFSASWRERADETGFKSLLVIPVDAGQRKGLAVVFFEEERRFDDEDLELARHLARAARGALERSELYESERTSRALSQQLTRMGRLLAAELDPAAVLEELVEQAPLLLGVEACSIRVREGGDLVVRAVAGRDTERVLGTRSAVTSRLAGDVLQTLSPLALVDVGEDDWIRQADPLLEGGYRAYLGVPLFATEGSPQGVLSLYSARPRSWREEEIEAVVALAGTASAVLANAELYQRVAIERERSLAILENVADGIVAVDREGNVVLWNDAAERITGVPRTEALGRTPAQVLQRNIALPGEHPAGNRLVAIRRGTEEVWLSLTEAIMRDPTGAEAGRIFAFRDVSADRAVEQMKSDFVSMVSQELRRPLTSIYGFAETLLRRATAFGEEERVTFLRYIASETERLTAIVDRLLSVARLDAGDLEVQLGHVDMRPLVSEAVARAERSETMNGHRFVLDLPDEPLGARADREKLKQVLAHLLDNAVRYSPQGGTVTVAARERGGAIEVRIVDEGIGISALDRERIFRKFYRGDSRGRNAGGTGLGLFLARGLVSAMGGRIWVDSEEGKGSSFVFELPAAVPSETEFEPERV